MRIINLILSASLILTSAYTADAKSFKRGVAENQFSLEGQMTPIEPGVSWYYNWGTAPGKGYKSEVENFNGFEFVPMCWNHQFDGDKIRTYCAAHPECTYLLGFNEPNFKAQSNLTPAQAAAEWPKVKALADELGLQLVSPAVNYSPDGPENDPFTWMQNFYDLVGPDAFDFVAIHCYGGAGLIESMVEEMYSRFGKKIWLTEFCLWPGGAGNVYVNPESQMADMIQSLKYLEKSDKIFRYAWFKAIGDHNAPNKPNYGLMVNQNGQGVRTLSQQGWIYTYLTDFDAGLYHHADELIAAAQFIDCGTILLDKTNNADCPDKLEISRFNAGSTADYQFDIAEAGNYHVEITVSGMGEPTRFNPTLAITAMNEDGSEGAVLAEPRQFALSNDDNLYTTQAFAVTLPAGRQTLRLKDANPFQPSGIRISTIKLVKQNSAVGIAEADEVNASTEVYNLCGQLVGDDESNLPAGVYVIKKADKVIKKLIK